ncbi:MAG: response regulator [Anaerolineales bacterium]|jgi:CheY-like chemotaxis protein
MTRILFVDDDPFTLETLTRAVEVFGHQAILANTGREALRMASAEKPDLIFVDMHLDDMNGLDVVRSLREDPSTLKVPIFVLSADPEGETSQKAKAAGARDYLNKPIRLQTLLDLIQENSSQ